MKYALFTIVALIVGFVLGGIGPRRDNAQLEEQVSSLETELKQAQNVAGRKPAVRYIPIPGMRSFGELESEGTTDATGSAPSESAARDLSPGSSDKERQRRFSWRSADRQPDSSERRMQRFEAAITAQKLRREQSRAALAEQAELDEDQRAEVDALTAKMNEDLSKHGEQILQMLSAEQEPEPLEFLYVSREVSEILYESQSKLDETIGSDNLSSVDRSAREIWNYVDLESFRATAERLEKMRVNRAPER